MPSFQLDFEKPLIEIEKRILELKALQEQDDLDFSSEINSLGKKLTDLRSDIYKKLTPWQRVLLARHPDRPYSLDYIHHLMTDFIEIHGDRYFGDDNAVVCGFATFRGKKCVVIGQQKGRETSERIYRNFGMMNPEGYRKAERVMKLAEKFSLPVIIFIDTPGAYPGIGAEERGQAEAIAKNLKIMTRLRVPLVISIIGEGASGGALGIGMGDRILMMENAWYTVISPEGCAAILFRDRAEAPRAAEALKLTAKDLLELGMIDEIVPEPETGAHSDHTQAARLLGDHIDKHLAEISSLSMDELLDKRFNKYRSMGVYTSADNNKRR